MPPEALTKATETLVERGVLGSLLVLSLIAIIFLFWRHAKALDRIEALYDKRVEDQRLVSEKFHNVLSENVKTLDTIASATVQSKDTLDDVRRSVETLMSMKRGSR